MAIRDDAPRLTVLVPDLVDTRSLQFLERYGTVLDGLAMVRMGGLAPAWYPWDPRPEDDQGVDGFLLPRAVLLRAGVLQDVVLRQGTVTGSSSSSANMEGTAAGG